MNVRYQIAVASVGNSLEPEREKIVKAAVEMGHMPIDLTASEVLNDAPLVILERHIDRTDYLALVFPSDERIPAPQLERAEQALALTNEVGVPVLGLLAVSARRNVAKRDADDSAVEALLDKLRVAPKGLVEKLEADGDSIPGLLNRLLDTFPRPGWVSATEIPAGNVAAELARLTKENAELLKQVSVGSAEQAELEEFDDIKESLTENRILIPLWARASSTWEKPVEMSLYDFFLRLGPELVVEQSTTAASEFIPIGVCELDPQGVQSRWVVPHHDLNLWMTDLMALGLVRPSRRKRPPKDTNQYWRLTKKGRRFLARDRRAALEAGGHRHVGFTREFPVVRRTDDDA